ncbi:MAG TPA: hypothetical protein VHR41_13645 [Gemmatimonadales bacterium]|nr:hypothetical protein [Gemmatimonadales bacterium]
MKAPQAESSRFRVFQSVVRHLLLARSSTALLGATALEAAAPFQARRSCERVAWPFDSSKPLLPVECGRLEVPENYDQPARGIELAFMIVHPRQSAGPKDPIIFLSGGPGAPSLVYAEMLVANPQIHDIVVDRDWVRRTARASLNS